MFLNKMFYTPSKLSFEEQNSLPPPFLPWLSRNFFPCKLSHSEGRVLTDFAVCSRFKQFYNSSDYISLHAPAIKEGLINLIYTPFSTTSSSTAGRKPGRRLFFLILLSSNLFLLLLIFT